MMPYLTEDYGNPSSLHSPGQVAKAAIEDVRARIARAIGARTDEIVFTSGGTEANNFAIKGVMFANRERGDHLVTTVIEHHSVLETCRFLERHGFKVTYVPVGRDGIVDPSDIEKAITDRTVLVSCMHANNEIGTIQPIREISKLLKDKGILFHTDAVQTVGHIPVDVRKLGVDLLSASAHKFYGPKGVGFLYIRRGTRISPFIHGGNQEHKRRAGTENVPGIVGMGKALEISISDIEEEMERLKRLRDRLISGIMERVDGVRLNGHPDMRLPNNVNLTVERVDGEALLVALDMEGIAASSGSACSSGSLDPSHVLLAIGLSRDEAYGSLRLTLGRSNSEEEVEEVVEKVAEVISRLRSLLP
jgi:cysteine desulfurase